MENVDKKLRVLYILAVVVWLVVCIVASFSSGQSLTHHLGMFLLFAPIPVAINQFIGIIINKEIWGNTVLYLTMLIVVVVGLLMCHNELVTGSGAKFWISCLAIYIIPFLLRLAWKTLKD